jgi:hypothetical protein
MHTCSVFIKIQYAVDCVIACNQAHKQLLTNYRSTWPTSFIHYFFFLSLLTPNPNRLLTQWISVFHTTSCNNNYQYNRITFHHITSHHIISHHIISHHITSHHITSSHCHHITSHITSHHTTSHHILSCTYWIHK